MRVNIGIVINAKDLVRKVASVYQIADFAAAPFFDVRLSFTKLLWQLYARNTGLEATTGS